MSSRPKLLFLCHTLPFPPDGGVWIRTYHVLRLLARAFDIHLLCFERSSSSVNGGPATIAECRDRLSRFASVEVFPIPQKHRRLRYVWDHLRSTVTRRAYTTYLYESAAFRARFEAILRSTNVDLVHVDSLDLAAYLPECRHLPVVCSHPDVESVLLRRRAAVECVKWRSVYLRYQARLREAVERKWCARVALNVVVSENDRVTLKRIAPASHTSVVPNGVDTNEFQPGAVAGTGIGFIGGLLWFPNLDALEFFGAEILPRIRSAAGDVPTVWIGAASSDQRRDYRERFDVEITGYVDDVRPSMSACACHVVPLRVGGGTRLKILNSWAMGMPVVSTSIGCEGLAASDGRNILIRDDPGEFASAVIAVLGDAALRERLGAGGRATAERHYSWSGIGRELIETYLTVANGGCRTAAPAIASARAGYARSQIQPLRRT